MRAVDVPPPQAARTAPQWLTTGGFERLAACDSPIMHAVVTCFLVDYFLLVTSCQMPLASQAPMSYRWTKAKPSSRQGQQSHRSS